MSDRLAKKKKEGSGTEKSRAVTEAKGIVFVCGRKKKNSKGLRHNTFLFFQPPFYRTLSRAKKAFLNEKPRACLESLQELLQEALYQRRRRYIPGQAGNNSGDMA